MQKSQQIFFTTIFVALFAAWFALLSQVRINSDAAWLTQAAEHFLSGHSMSEYYFETNPPMSVLIYIPVVFLKSIGLHTWDALNIYIGSLTLFSLFSSWYYLRQWGLNGTASAVTILGVLLSTAFLSTYDYGQRDHIIAITLLPFVLAQLSITYRYQTRALVNIPVFLIGSIFILVKPHFGIIPVSLFLLRLYKEKNLRFVLDSDFIILALATLSYIAIVFTAFPDFVEIILPVSMDIYAGAPVHVTSTQHALVFAFLSGLLGIFISFANIPQEQKILFITLSIASALCLVPYVMQNKGFHYHLIPYFTLASAVILPTAYFYIRDVAAGKLTAVFFIVLIAGLALLNVQIYQTNKLVNHHFLDDSPIAQRIAHTPENSSFYIEHISTNIVTHISEYCDREYASRLPAIWTFPSLALLETDKQKYEHYINLTKELVFDDFERYEPAVIFLLNDPNTLNILSAYRDTPRFSAFFNDYVYEGRMQSKYFSYMFSKDQPTEFEYAVYARKDLNNE